MNTAVAHPQANGLVERDNKSLMEGIKARLGRERSEIGMPTYQTMMIREDEDEDELRLNMDLLQERREAAAIREAKNEARRVEDQGKLGPKWEGPYKVTEAYQNGSYKLQTMGGNEVPRT
ncbi:hypothetical protein Tco_0651833 [Tanacetum coccineum]|uniref:Reverse transcriptase domain-containing protein n=1 Tax=Tanacetum coccineum TaxID=301880 RepID=A0ABQ4WVX9_9ASTR